MEPARIVLVRGDITLQDADAIVNAANTSLLGGGGVDGAIHRGAGPALLEECRKLGGCPTGEARITRGYNLRARWVIHTVGPVWRGGQCGEPRLLASCYLHCLELARKKSLAAVAFPSIGTGAYGYPVGLAAAIAVAQVTSYLAVNRVPREVRFVAFDAETHAAYESALQEMG